MSDLPWYWPVERAWLWLTSRPMVLGYWLIWLNAKLGNEDAGHVHGIMWDIGLGVPPLTAEQKANRNAYPKHPYWML